MSKFRSRDRKVIAPPSKRAVGYVRVSTAGQAAEGVSLEAQRARIEAWCIAHEYELLGCHEDAGISGRNTDRPGFTAAVSMACHQRATLVAYSLSRLTRSTQDLYALAARLADAEANLASLTEDVNTDTATGKLMFGLLAVMAEFEANLVSERTKSALAHKKAKGEHCGRAPRGTRIEGKRLVIADERELATYRRACQLKATGQFSYQQIADQLLAEGYQPRGARFWPSQVHRWTTNPRLHALHPAADA